MTVSELIEKLKGYNGGLRVVVDGYEEGYDDPDVFIGAAVLEENWDGEKKVESWHGRHEEVSPYSDGGVTVLVIGR